MGECDKNTHLALRKHCSSKTVGQGDVRFIALLCEICPLLAAVVCCMSYPFRSIWKSFAANEGCIEQQPQASLNIRDVGIFGRRYTNGGDLLSPKPRRARELPENIVSQGQDMTEILVDHSVFDFGRLALCPMSCDCGLLSGPIWNCFIRLAACSFPRRRHIEEAAVMPVATA